MLVPHLLKIYFGLGWPSSVLEIVSSQRLKTSLCQKLKFSHLCNMMVQTWYFKLKLFNLSEFILWNIQGVRLQSLEVPISDKWEFEMNLQSLIFVDNLILEKVSSWILDILKSFLKLLFKSFCGSFINEKYIALKQPELSTDGEGGGQSIIQP